MKRLTFLLSSFAAVTLSPAVAEEPAARPYWRTIVRGTHGMAAAEHPLEAMARFEALKAGGNAIDAALAAFYMTTVAEQRQPGAGTPAFASLHRAQQRKAE